MLVPVFILRIDKCLKGKTEVLQRLTLSCSIRDREVSFHFGPYTILARSRLSVSENDFEKKRNERKNNERRLFSIPRMLTENPEEALIFLIMGKDAGQLELLL